MKSTFTRKKVKKETGATADAGQEPVSPARGGKRDGAAAAGLPPFLSQSIEPTLVSRKVRATPKLKPDPANEARESEADRASEHVRQGGGGGGPGVSQKVSRVSDGEALVGGLVERRLGASKAGGEPLPSPTRSLMEEKFGGADFGGVRVHTDEQAGRAAESFNANAFTSGEDIYFNRGVYDPATNEGRGLLAHELTHVLQQRGANARAVQFHLQQSMPATHGSFTIDMIAVTTPKVGLEGHIRFLPDPSGPYSAQIGLIQVVSVADVGGITNTAGDPVDWNDVGTGEESERNVTRTTGADGAPAGWYVDMKMAGHDAGTAYDPNYLESYGESDGHNEYGWLRSPTDTHDASLYDYANSSIDLDFDFETVAKATDTQTIYGTLKWGFGIRSGVVVGEYASTADAPSATFDEALERFRGYFTHEPVVIYFDTGADTPTAGEDAKITGVLDYLRRYPDARVQIDGWADERGDLAYNKALALKRAENVRALAVKLGISESRINPPSVGGETTAFAYGADEPTLRANRRVVVSFVRTASTPIVMP